MRSAMLVEAALPLRRHLHLDHRGDPVEVELVLVHDRLVAADDALLLVVGNLRLHVLTGKVQHPGDVLRRFQRVLFQYLEQFVHGAILGHLSGNVYGAGVGR